ncbi:PKD domain-containing protein [Geodermatophilus sp. SYSU D00691]
MTSRFVAGVVSLLLVAAALGMVGPEVAKADSAPPASAAQPTTVSADPLPTVQVNGVVWSQVVVGNTVYVAGRFTRARPAGAAAGTQEVVRNNLLAYDIRTGALVTSFTPDLNAQAMVVTASPDGSRIYVGGDFTVANGQARSRIAAYDTATGALVTTFRPSVNSQVRAIAVSSQHVHFGGSFSAVGGVSRTRLAAVRPDGTLLPWAPVPNGTANEVLTMVLANNGALVVAGGRFATVNGVSARGIAAIDALSGQTRSYGINSILTNNGPDSAVWGLSTDGTNVYGTAYDYGGPGNFEGAFAVDPATGSLRWGAYCRGDSYSSFATGGALYVASHQHNCSFIGGFAETNPVVWKYATAFGLSATTTISGNLWNNQNWMGKPAPSMLNWWPALAQGSVTGQYQAGWSVSGNAQYVVYGGEFPRVGGVAQQGLVRFAMPSLAPNGVGPDSSTGLTPTLASLGAGTLRVSWRATSDVDNEHLTYRVYRDGGTTPVYTTTRASQWWTMPTIAFADTGLSAGTHTYRVTASDPFGNTVTSGTTSATVATGGTTRPYVQAVQAATPSDYWTLGDRSGAAYDLGGTADLTLATGVTRGAAGAVSGDADTAYAFNGTANAYASTRQLIAGPNTFAVEAWFQTTSAQGGRIVGFGDTSTGQSNIFDRHLYMDTAGRVLFGAKPTPAGAIVQSGTGLNDGRWHHVVGSIGGGVMSLYVDGDLVASRTGVTGGERYNGYWRIGADKSWAGASTWNGRIDEVAIYPAPLTADQVRQHHTLGSTGSGSNLAPTARFQSTVSDLAATVDGSASADTDGTVSSWEWSFGDGSIGTGRTQSHTYAAAGTYTVQLTVTDDDGATHTVTAPVTVTAPPPNRLPNAVFTSSASGLTATFDGRGSSDADGTIAGHAWAFGDGATATGPTASHDYAAAGTYTVQLTVTDDDGATHTSTGTVTVTATQTDVLVRDTFGRTVTGGLGTADVGGRWTASAGATRQSVTPGAAVLTVPGAGNNTGSYLDRVLPAGTDTRTTFSLSAMPTGTGTYVYVTGRRVGTGTEYRVRVRLLPDGTVALALSRLSGGAETFPGGEVVVPGVTYTAGSPVNVRVQVSGTGTTTVRATVWTGATEPATPQLVRTDTTAALQSPGGVGLNVYRPSANTVATTVRVTAFTVTPLA